MPPVHRPSHRGLLTGNRVGRPRAIDAVIVPAGRPAHHLQNAAQLATELGCVLLAMCSPLGADPAAFAATAHRRWPTLRWCHLHVPDDFAHPLLPPTATPDAAGQDWRHGPLSTKRNVALLVARMVGWRTVLLVDDDIVGLNPHEMRIAASGLEHASIVGFKVSDQADNSTVCHARRLAGESQDVFVGACALVVDTARPFGYFPNIYNEDWLFLYDQVAQRTVARLDRSSVRQLHHDPFTAERAAAEEFGDIIAEGLMAGLHAPEPVFAPVAPGYWEAFLDDRHALVARVAERLRDRDGDEHRRALAALVAADLRRGTVTPAFCADYVSRWRSDLASWHAQLPSLPTVGDVDAAADRLGLGDSLVGLAG